MKPLELISFLLIFASLAFFLRRKSTKKPITIKKKSEKEIEIAGEEEDEYSETTIQIENTGFSGWNKKYHEVVSDDPNAPAIVARGREKFKDEKVGIITKKYYENIEKVRQAKKSGNYKLMEKHSDIGLEMVEALILDTKKCFGKFDLTSIPAIDDVLPIYAVQGQSDKLEEIKSLVSYFPELDPWIQEVSDAEEKVSLTKKVMDIVKSNPGVLQKDIKTKLQIDDGSEAANVIYYLESIGKIRKEKFKNTNKLFYND